MNFITNSDKRTLNSLTGYKNQLDYMVYLTATHDFGAVTNKTLVNAKYLLTGDIVHRIHVKAAVIVRRNIRQGHDWHNDKGHCRKWIGKYNKYMNARKFKSYQNYQALVEEIITNTGAYNGR